MIFLWETYWVTPKRRAGEKEGERERERERERRERCDITGGRNMQREKRKKSTREKERDSLLRAERKPAIIQ